MKKPLLIALFAAAAFAPLGAAQASGGVIVSVSTPGFGLSIGAPLYGPPLYAPAYAPPVVVPTPRVVYRPPVIAPRVVYAPIIVARPHFGYPYGAGPGSAPPYVQRTAYRTPPGHARHHHAHGYED
jgi:hypothetical protein